MDALQSTFLKCQSHTERLSRQLGHTACSRLLFTLVVLKAALQSSFLITGWKGPLADCQDTKGCWLHCYQKHLLLLLNKYLRHEGVTKGKKCVVEEKKDSHYSSTSPKKNYPNQLSPCKIIIAGEINPTAGKSLHSHCKDICHLFGLCH